MRRERYGAPWQMGFRDLSGYEQKAKISIDVAKKKRNTRVCFEVGYVPSVVPLAGEIFSSQAHRTTNCSITLS
jgi:hypothetical protein